MKTPRKITLSPPRPDTPVLAGCVRFTSTHEWRDDLAVECEAIFDGVGPVFHGSDPTSHFKHRVWLRWSVDPNKPHLIACMLNPSTATHEKLDPTISGLLKRAIAWGYGGVIVVNVYSYRATKPKDMPKQSAHRNTDNSHRYINIALNRAKRGGVFVCGWGAHKDAHISGIVVAVRAKRRGVVTHAFQINAGGSPKHPLYVRHDLKPVEWTPLYLTDEESAALRKPVPPSKLPRTPLRKLKLKVRVP